jgi:hypothetical protein
VKFRSNKGVGVRKRVAVGLAILAVLFATSIALLHHDDPTSSAVCQVCHLVNLPLLGPQVSIQVPKPIKFRDKAPVLMQGVSLDSVSDHASPRAPPSA